MTGSSIPSSYSPELEQVLENDSFVEDGTSSHCSSPSSPEERKTNLRQMFIFDNRTDELISLEDSNAEATSQLGNISFGADSDLMMVSRESDSIMLANEGAQNREELTWLFRFAKLVKVVTFISPIYPIFLYVYLESKRNFFFDIAVLLAV